MSEILSSRIFDTPYAEAYDEVSNSIRVYEHLAIVQARRIKEHYKTFRPENSIEKHLDIGCGTGNTIAPLCDIIDPNNYYGIEIAPVIWIADQKVRGDNPYNSYSQAHEYSNRTTDRLIAYRDRIRLVMADGCRLPFQSYVDEILPFDAITMIQSFHWLTQSNIFEKPQDISTVIQERVSELGRLVRPGGVIALDESVVHHTFSDDLEKWHITNDPLFCAFTHILKGLDHLSG